MKNERPDGQSVRALLEAALATSLGAHPAPAASNASTPASSSVGSSAVGSPLVGSPPVGSPVASSPVTSSPATGSPVVVGEIVDTHHPHLPCRVLVRWWPSADVERSEWLHHERHLTLTRGDRVLVTLPLGWGEWLVTGALGRTPLVEARTAGSSAASSSADDPARGAEPGPAQPEPAPPGAAEPERPARIQLEPGQALLVVGHDGAPLLQVRQAPEGLRLELARDQVEISARRRLRLSADSIEIAAGPGGVDVRTDGEAVTRARAIRLN